MWTLLLLTGLISLDTWNGARAACLSSPSGLVNWWPGENSGTDVAGNNNATLLNGTTFATGFVGSAFSFDGTNDLLAIGAPALPPPWTAEFWVNRQAAPEDSAVLLSDTNAALKLEQYPNTKRVGITRWAVQDYSFNYTAPIGVWTHLVFVGSASATTLYVNGALHSSLAVGISLPRATLGRDITNRFNKALKGLVDEPSLYNRALTATEILALYNAGSDGKCLPNNCTNNDAFACREIITGSSLTNVTTSLGATREPDEPQHAGVSSSNSIWFSWLAPASGGVVIEATTDFDFASPILAVYTGNTLTTLSNVAFNFTPFNGNGSPLNKARVLFTAVSNQVYQIALDGKPVDFFESQGAATLTLTLSPPPVNDRFQDASTLSGVFYEITNATFRGASRELGEPDHGTNFAQTLWWKWTAPTNLGVSQIPVRLTADAVSHAPAIAVYTGSSVGALAGVTTAQVADGMTRTATFSAAPGTTYRIAVAGLQNDDNAVLPLVGDFRFRFNTRALALNIGNVTSSLNATGAVQFTATASVTNRGAANSGPLRVRVTALPGISMRGLNVSAITELPEVQGDWPSAPLSPAQFTNLPISGIAPPHTDVEAGSSSARGYGVHAELQELGVSSSWITVDESLVAFGDWPDLNGIPGPGGGVIRLDPAFIGGSAFNPLQSVSLVGPPTAIEGNPTAYFGRAIYYNGAQLDFSNTVWLATLPSITNGWFKPGIVNSNTAVTLTAQFSNSGFLYSATTNVLVLNLPSPMLSQALRVGANFVTQIQGVSNRTHVVEAATNLSPPVAWLPVSTNVLGPGGMGGFTNAIGSFPQRFFRAREVE
jgi:hypothetical protein